MPLSKDQIARRKKAYKPIKTEFNHITQVHKPYNSLHEALAVLEEEIHEFRMEVYKSPKKHPDRMKLALEEIKQVGAIALRIIYDFGDQA